MIKLLARLGARIMWHLVVFAGANIVNCNKHTEDRLSAWWLRLHRAGERPFKFGERVRMRFCKEDTFTPERWEKGVIGSLPIVRRGKTYYDVVLSDKIRVCAQSTDNIR